MQYRPGLLTDMKMSDVKSDKFIWIVFTVKKNYNLNQYHLYGIGIDCSEDSPSNRHSLI